MPLNSVAKRAPIGRLPPPIEEELDHEAAMVLLGIPQEVGGSKRGRKASIASKQLRVPSNSVAKRTSINRDSLSVEEELDDETAMLLLGIPHRVAEPVGGNH